MKAAHRVVVVSTLLAELIHESLRIPRSSILVLPNGVDLTRFRGASSVHRHDGRSIRIGYVGVLKENYGIEDLIRSMALLREEARSPAHELIVVGHGPARRSLERLASELDNVTFAGAVEPDEVPALLRSMDVLAYTSTRVNGFQSPIKLYEYMAAGRAIVAAATPQVRELFASGEIGLTYECGNVRELTDQMSILLSDCSLRERLGKSAAAEAVNHSWDARISRLWSAL